MDDPLGGVRAELARRHAGVGSRLQADLFAAAGAAAPA
jgi:hypothetical protein